MLRTNPTAQSPRVLPNRPPIHAPRVPPTSPPPQDPRVNPTSPPYDSAPISRHTRSQSHPTLTPPATPSCEIYCPLEPIVYCTLTHHEASHVVTTHSDARHKYPLLFIANWAMPVLDKATVTSLEYRSSASSLGIVTPGTSHTPMNLGVSDKALARTTLELTNAFLALPLSLLSGSKIFLLNT